MTFDEIRSIYFDWICRIAYPDEHDRENHSRLLELLYSKWFEFTIPMDKNRYTDGLDLRHRFGYEIGINDDIISQLLDDRPCSILEMMVALALRAEQIMSNETYTKEAANYFSVMVNNLKIGGSTNDNFDENWVEYRINRFLDRDYDYNGNGGLFTVENPRQDMRRTEIWYQMNWYLSEVLGKELL